MEKSQIPGLPAIHIAGTFVCGNMKCLGSGPLYDNIDKSVTSIFSWHLLFGLFPGLQTVLDSCNIFICSYSSVYFLPQSFASAHPLYNWMEIVRRNKVNYPASPPSPLPSHFSTPNYVSSWNMWGSRTENKNINANTTQNVIHLKVKTWESKFHFDQPNHAMPSKIQVKLCKFGLSYV